MPITFRGPTIAVACAVVLLGFASVPAVGSAAVGSDAHASTGHGDAGSLAAVAPSGADELVEWHAQINGSLADNDTLDGGTTSGETTATPTDDGTASGNGSIGVDVGGVSVDANLSGSSDGTNGTVSAGGNLNASGTTVTTNATLNDSGATVEADASVDGTAVEARAATTIETTGRPTTSPATRTGGAAGTGSATATNASGGGLAPAGGDDDGSSGGSDDRPSGGGLPSAPTAAFGAAAIAGGAAAAHRGLSAVSHGPTPTGLSHTLSAGVDWLRWHAPKVLVPFGYSRYDDSDPLEHEERAALYDHVERSPGVHLSGLAEEVDVSLSSVRHHVRILAEESLVEHRKIRGKRRFFPVGEVNPELVAALEDPATASVLRAVAAAEPASVSELADRLGRDPSTISHHLSGLEADGLVERERNGQAVETRVAAETRDVLAVEAETPMPTPAD